MPRLPAPLRRLAAMSSRFISLSLTCGRSLTWRAVITIFLVNVWANWITASPRWGTRWCCVSVVGVEEGWWLLGFYAAAAAAR